ncbi:MAG: DUF7557 family protein [Promethearchaeota archaeon]
MGNVTTIQLSIETKKKLDKLKMSKRETYNDIIENLIEDSLELNEETLKDLKKAIEEVKRGNVHSLEKVKSEMGF